MAGETKQEDSEKQVEINLLDLFIVLLKYKWMILTFVLVAAILGFVYIKIASMQSDNKNLHLPADSIFYYSECLIEPDSGVKEKISALLPRHNFFLKMLEENHLLSDVEQAILNEKRKGEITSGKPTTQEVQDWLNQNLFQTPSGNLIAIGLTSREKDLPSKIINAFLSSMSEYLRSRDLEIFTKQENLLRRHLAATHNSLLKDRIALSIIDLVDKKTMAESKKYYGFELIDPPSIIERVRINKKGNEKKIEVLENVFNLPQTLPTWRAKYTMVIVLLILTSLVVGVTLAFFIEYINNIKKLDPEKFAVLKRYLSIRPK